ncbi:MAG: UDP-N-acetylmuramoyl-L-alanine--D-glutamate ligase [Thermodesulfobacterium sp.]|nr:UDP-N-acetylmuramoyl-L-alanine--D-glutamate ligase [Thermodesulfobacterium sp.]
MDVRGKKVVVVGFGKSGQSAVRLLLVKGANVVVSESKPKEELPPSMVSSFEVQGVVFETGAHREETLRKADLVVVSPGVPQEVYLPALRAGVPVISELELAWSYLSEDEKKRTVAITGTNGKTTTTAMVSDLFKFAGEKVFTGGNYGIPLSDYVLSNVKVDRIVLELSSFQLERIETFAPKVGVLLNITPDHLERYRDLKEYAYYKYRLFENQTPEDFAILAKALPYFEDFKGMVKGETLFFGEKEEKGLSAYLKNGYAILKPFGEEEVYSLHKFKLLGVHNRLNLLSALLVGKVFGVSKEVGQRLIDNFIGFPHRIEFVGTFGGVHFINDSKATNVDATLQALRGLPSPIILILGGRHKGGSYAPLIPLIKEKVRVLILMGEARWIIADELANLVETYVVEDLPSALAVAFKTAKPGDTVLLSPACSSFDQFRDYAERGEVFRQLVLEYAPKYLGKKEEGVVYH